MFSIPNPKLYLMKHRYNSQMRNVNNSRSLVRKPLSQTQLHKKLALKYYIHGKKNPQVDINLDINAHPRTTSHNFLFKVFRTRVKCHEFQTKNH